MVYNAHCEISSDENIFLIEPLNGGISGSEPDCDWNFTEVDDEDWKINIGVAGNGAYSFCTPVTFLNPATCTDENIQTLEGLSRKDALKSLAEKTNDERFLDLISEASSDNIDRNSDTDNSDYLDYLLNYDINSDTDNNTDFGEDLPDYDIG